MPSQIHNVDLAGRDVPWAAIGRLSALQELSLWGNGMSGVIEAAALCGLTALRVLALSQNLLQGVLPECMANMELLVWCWLDDNRSYPTRDTVSHV